MSFSSRFSNHLVVGLLFLITMGLLCTNLSAQLSSFAGTWTGTWSSPFGSGSITLEVMISGDDVTADLTQTGTIFAIPGPHGPFTLTGTFDSGSGIVLTDPDNSLYGPLTVTIGLDGMGTTSAPSVPGGLVSSASGSGTLDEMNLTSSGSGVALLVGEGSVSSPFTLTLTSPAPPALNTFFFPRLVEGQAGNINFSTLVVLENTSTSSAATTLDFFDEAGAPLTVELAGEQPASSFTFTLTAGETRFLQTPGTTDPLQVGYARVTAPSGVSGLVIFTRQDSGTTVSKTGVPASGVLTDFSVPVDTLGNNNIGVAIVNPPAGGTPTGGGSPQATANLTVRLYDKDFNLLGTQTITLATGEVVAGFVTDPAFFEGVPGVEEMTGSFTVENDLAVAVAVLLQDDDLAVGFPTDVPILTTFPAIPGRADQ